MPTTTTTSSSSSTGVSLSSSNRYNPHELQHEDPDDDLPPAYTPAPDSVHGETTIEYGPNRPFQPAPQPQRPGTSQPSSAGTHNHGGNVHSHSHSHLTGQGVGVGVGSVGGGGLRPQHTSPTTFGGSGGLGGRNQGLGTLLNTLAAELQNFASRPNESLARLNSHLTGSSNSSAGGSGSPYHNPSSSSSSSYGRPPQHNAGQPYRPVPPPLPPRRPLSAGALVPGPSTTQFSGAPPSPPSTAAPQPQPTSDFARDFYAVGAQGSASTGALPSRVSGALPSTGVGDGGAGGAGLEHGKPTTMPVPGHPLLNEGRLLVYPKGYECVKCHNVGYYKFPAFKPCKKCWAKFSKPFSGPLAYSYSAEAGTVESASNFQRPLPPTLSTTLTPNPTPSSSGYPGSAARPLYAAHPTGGGGSYIPPPPPPPPRPSLLSMPGGLSNSHSHSHSHSISSSSVRVTTQRPPRGAVVYAPGDARLGGRRCWRCDGRGSVSGLFLVDREGCGVCVGVGRVYT